MLQSYLSVQLDVNELHMLRSNAAYGQQAEPFIGERMGVTTATRSCTASDIIAHKVSDAMTAMVPSGSYVHQRYEPELGSGTLRGTR